jgi:hypothetical protein
MNVHEFKFSFRCSFSNISCIVCLWQIILLCSSSGNAQWHERPRPRFIPEERERSFTARIGRATFAVPLTWWRIDLKDTSDVSFRIGSAADMVSSVVTLSGDTLRSRELFEGLSCGEAELLQFFRMYKPKFIQRVFAPRRMKQLRQAGVGRGLFSRIFPFPMLFVFLIRHGNRQSIF